MASDLQQDLQTTKSKFGTWLCVAACTLLTIMDQVWSVSFNKSGTRLASGGDDGMLNVFQLGCLKTLGS